MPSRQVPARPVRPISYNNRTSNSRLSAIMADEISNALHPSRSDWQRISEMTSIGLRGARSHYFRLGSATCVRMLQRLQDERRRMEDVEMRTEDYIASRLLVMIKRYVAHPVEITFDMEEAPEEESWADVRCNRPKPDGVI